MQLRTVVPLLRSWTRRSRSRQGYQGGAVPDVQVLDIKRSELRDRFDELYQVLNPATARAARQAKLEKLKS